MRTVRLSWNVASLLLGLLEDYADHPAVMTLKTAMGAKPKRSIVLGRKRRAPKKAAKRAQTDAIREALLARSGGGCELCPQLGTELHHALGRVRAKQSPGNCLWLCHGCHWGITNSRPNAALWLDAQARRFVSLGYSATARTLEKRLEFVEAREALSAVSP